MTARIGAFSGRQINLSVRPIDEFAKKSLGNTTVIWDV
jgi:hypothetical protein